MSAALPTTASQLVRSVAHTLRSTSLQPSSRALHAAGPVLSRPARASRGHSGQLWGKAAETVRGGALGVYGASDAGRLPSNPRRAPWRPLTASSSSANSARMSDDYYTLLGVRRDATAGEIKKAYYQLAKDHHPDRGGGAADADLFARVNTAYETLSDPRKRRIYDRHGEDGVRAADAGADPDMAGGPFGGGGFGRASQADVEDLLRNFGEFFARGGGGGAGPGGPAGGMGRKPQADAPKPGANRQASTTISLRDAAFGVTRSLHVAARETCSACDGTGKSDDTYIETCTTCDGEGRVVSSQGMFGTVVMECPRCEGMGGFLRRPCATCKGEGAAPTTKKVEVSFPPGCESGMVLRVRGGGDAGTRGGRAGDLFVEVTVQEDPYFHRRGRDLHVVAPISFAQAALGGKVTVRTLDGEESVHVRAGTQPDDTTTLSGRALRDVNGRKRGDQFVHFKVVVPDKPEGRQRELLEELLELEGGKLTRPEDCSSRGLLQRFQRFLRRNVKG